MNVALANRFGIQSTIVPMLPGLVLLEGAHPLIVAVVSAFCICYLLLANPTNELIHKERWYCVHVGLLFFGMFAVAVTKIIAPAWYDPVKNAWIVTVIALLLANSGRLIKVVRELGTR